ncbi:hypothetical protein [Idiomarina sp.]|uniref:hypothetical protein n=1 Tax=Idiomarina sp. TaxID=1874361 RepID=UPI003A931F98
MKLKEFSVRALIVLVLLLVAFTGVGVLAALAGLIFDCDSKPKNSSTKTSLVTHLPNTFRGLACDQRGGTCIEAFIMRSITERTIKDFASAVELYPKLKTVCFANKGGSVRTARIIYKFLQNNNYDTCMASYYEVSQETDSRLASKEDYSGEVISKENPSCSSSCAVMLLAGKNRIAIGSNFQLQVHRPGRKFCFSECEWRFDAGTFFMGDFEEMIENAKDMSELNKRQYQQQIATKPFDDRNLREIGISDALNWQVFTEKLE